MSRFASRVLPLMQLGSWGLTRRRRIDIGLKVVIASAAVLYALFPVAFIISAALSPTNSLVNAELIPRGATLDNFARLVNDPQHPFLLWLWNSVKVSGISAILIVALTAESLEQLKSRFGATLIIERNARLNPL